MPTIIAVNQTPGSVFLEDLGVTVPASGSLNLTDTLFVYEIQDDDQLKAEIANDVLLINDGLVTLTKQDSLNFITTVATTADPTFPTSDTTSGGVFDANKFFVLDAAGLADGRDLGADGLKLDGITAGAEPTDFATIAAALDASGGAVPGLVFKTDGAGGGSMELNTQTIANRVTVGKSGDVDFNSVKAAVDYVATQSPGPTNSWLITVFPSAGGAYVEDPMTILPGMVISTVDGQRPGTVTIQANDATEDLFTMAGGGLNGIDINGVTDPTKACVRIATAGVLSVFFNCAVRGCSTGFHVSNAAQAVFVNHSSVINNVGQDITSCAIHVTDPGTFAAFSGGFISVPAAILPFYATNPINCGLMVTNGSRVSVSSMFISVRDKDGTTAGVTVDGGSRLAVFAVDFQGNSAALRIGSTGVQSAIGVQAATFDTNTLNFEILSSTGVIFASCAVDSEKSSVVAGATLSGVFQELDQASTDLSGVVTYQQPSTRKVPFEAAFHGLYTSGISGLTSGIVTDAGGLAIDITAGTGWAHRFGAFVDTTEVSWDASLGVALTANTTNYVYYDGDSLALAVALTPPSDSKIPLAEVVTDGTGIRFIHDTRVTVTHRQADLDTYLLATRKFASVTGTIASAGTTVRKIDVSSGTWYRGMFLLSYAGSGGDATFSSFYGAAGATEVPGQTDVDITNYDNAGVLTAMTAGFFRSDTLILTSDGRLSLFFGEAEFATETDAVNNGVIAIIPSFLEQTGIKISRLIVEQGVGVSQFLDIRPNPNAADADLTGGGASTTVHSALSGLGPPADDHPQYLLATGARALSGDLDGGGNNITNVNLVDGVDVAAHAARHAPGSVDALPTGVPTGVQVGAAPTEGVGVTYARNDHQHGITTAAPIALVPDGGNVEGTASTVARSNHQHNVPAGTPTTGIGGGNAKGVAANFALSDHNHGLRETSGPDELTIADILDGQRILRSGATLAGDWFGTLVETAEDLTPRSSTLVEPNFTTQLTMTTANIPAGTYLLHWSYMWNHDARTSSFISRMLVDGASINPVSGNEWARTFTEPKDSSGTSYPSGSSSGTEQSYAQSGWFFVTFASAAVRTFDLQWCSSAGGIPSTIWDARLLLFRVS